MAAWIITVPLAGGLVACGNLAGPDHQLVITGAEQSDTVFASLEVPLGVQVLADGEPVANVVVHFSPRIDYTLDEPHVIFSYLGRGLMSFEARSDANGTIWAPFRFNDVAGEALVRIEVPALGLEEEVAFHVLPGAPALFTGLTVAGLGPTNVVPLGASVRLVAEFGDRYGNRFNGASTCSSDNPGITVTSDCQTYGVAFGVASITFRSGDLESTESVRVIPRAQHAFSFGRDHLALAMTDSSSVEMIGDWLSGPTWSPDGGTLVGRKDGHLFYQNVGSGSTDQQRLIPTFRAREELTPVFSPDGAWIYFTAVSEGGATELWRVRADGSSPEPLHSTSGRVEGRAAWPAPDGGRLVFVASSQSSTVLSILDLETGIVSELVPPSSGFYPYAFAPSWSPTGEWIAYSVVPGFGRESELRLIHPDGTGGRQLEVPPPASGVSWSPDGSYFIYTWNSSPPHSTGDRLFHVMVEVATGRSVTLPRMFNPPSFRGWSLSTAAWRP